jgi:hypothetical protein
LQNVSTTTFLSRKIKERLAHIYGLLKQYSSAEIGAEFKIE